MHERILVVDDDSDILVAVQMTLEDEGYTTQTITNGWETSETVATFHPQLILLDVFLSGVDGREIASMLKRQTSTSHIPIVMLSAQPDVEATARAAGADAFIAKPFDIDVLLATVEKYTRDG
jgi:DNA-binding response OmpR family regulator